MPPIPSHLPADSQPGHFTPDDVVALSRAKLFAGCPAELVARVTQHAFVRHVPHSALLLQPGESNSHVFVLLEGQLGVYRDATHQHLLSRLVPGDSVGEHALQDSDGSVFYISAQWPARVAAIEAQALRALMLEVPPLAVNVVDLLLARLRDFSRDVIAGEGGAESLEFMSNRDAVTGLHNRRWMTETFTDELARADRDGVHVCLMLIDVDYFARLNQALGRAAGDMVLKQVADVIRYGLRPTDLCARITEDSFAALLPGVSVQVAGIIAERIRAQIAGRQFPVQGHIATQLTVSIGVSEAHGGLDAGLQRAEELLARAKSAGRNRVETTA